MEGKGLTGLDGILAGNTLQIVAEEALQLLAQAIDPGAAVAQDLDAPIVVEQIRRVADRNAPPFPALVLASTRFYLASDDEETLGSAIRAVGALEDAAATDALVGFLDATQPSLRSDSHRALVQISGQRFGRQRAMWDTWLTRELAWKSDVAPGVLQQLYSNDAVEVISAINAIVSHPLFRHELSEELMILVDHEDARVCRISCIALGQIGSSVALPALEGALRDTEVAEQAQAALDSIQSRERSSAANN